jgi:hypothetical protein
MPSSGMSRLVAVVTTDVSEELGASIISDSRHPDEGGATLVVTTATRCNIPEDGILRK